MGAAPEVVRSDNLSAATHKLKDGKGRDFNERYKEILDHYGLKATRTNSYSAHENGVAEQGHRRLKDAVAQALVLRGSSDFESVEQYAKFVRSIVDRRNRLVREKLAGEYPHLRALPHAPVPEYVSYTARVLKWSTIRVDSRTYSVPSRLIGVMVDVRLYPDHVEVYYKGHLAESMERIRGKGKARIDYRHIIGSLVRKPGAFARYRFREQLYPTHTFRLAYDAMCGWKGERADVDYVRILHLAATTMECEVERALRRLAFAYEWQAGGVQAGSRLAGDGVCPDAVVLSGERLASAVHHDGVAGLEFYALFLGNVFKLPAVDRLFNGDIGLSAMLGDVEEHAARKDAVAPCVHSAVVRALEGERVFRLPAVPHAIFVPDMAESVDVCGRCAVIYDAIVVHRRAGIAGPFPDLHVVLRWSRVLRIGRDREGPAEGHGAPLFDQPDSLQALLLVDEVHSASRALVAPAPPVAPLAQVS